MPIFCFWFQKLKKNNLFFFTAIIFRNDSIFFSRSSRMFSIDTRAFVSFSLNFFSSFHLFILIEIVMNATNMKIVVLCKIISFRISFDSIIWVFIIYCSVGFLPACLFIWSVCVCVCVKCTFFIRNVLVLLFHNFSF